MRKNTIIMVVSTFLLLAGCSSEPTATEPVVEKQPVVEVDQSKEIISTSPSKEEHNKNEEVDQPEETTETSLKDEYLKLLTDQEEVDKNKEVTDTTTIALIAEETQRYETWDKLLNVIYGVLKTQLPESEMTKLKEEQREWIVYRDATAKESSLKYEGGTMENLEYVATQATLTRERCYELVAKYMK